MNANRFRTSNGNQSNRIVPNKRNLMTIGTRGSQDRRDRKAACSKKTSNVEKYLFGSVAQVPGQVSIDDGSRRQICVRDQVVPVLGLLQSTESHLGSGDVFLRVLEVLILSRVSPESFVGLGIAWTNQSVLVPFDPLGLVGIGV